MDKFFFVSYDYIYKRGEEGDYRRGNIIIKNIHPFIWLCNPPESFKESNVAYINWWMEIIEDVYEKTKKLSYIECEEDEEQPDSS